MRLFSLLLLTFIGLPLAELSLLLILGKQTRWWVPLALVVVTGICGAWLARWQGARTYLRIQDELRAGRMPTDALLDAALIFVAGALLLTPGILTDILGFSLLVPPCRRLYKRGLARWLQSRFQVHTVYHGGPAPPANGDRIVDSYVVGRTEEPGGKNSADGSHRAGPFS